MSTPKSDWFLSRELSWLEFNARVLEEARNPGNPLLERLKFCCIFASNLDEFFMVRVPGLWAQDAAGLKNPEAVDGLPPAQTLRSITERTHTLIDSLYACFRDEIQPGLAAAGIRILKMDEVKGAEAAALEKTFHQEVLPVLTPMAIDPAHPFPHIQNRALNIAVALRSKGKSGKIRNPGRCLAVVPVPGMLPRLIPISQGEGQDRFVLLEDLIGSQLAELFSGFDIVEQTRFRITRDADLNLDEEEASNLMKLIEAEIQRRKRGAATRLEIGTEVSAQITQPLCAAFDLEPTDVYQIQGPVNLAALMPLTQLKGYAPLHDEPFIPQIHPRVVAHKGDLFSLIRQSDLLFHHPYQSFQTIVDFLNAASEDPDVLAIKITLYRTGKDSPIMEALERAAEHDKQVTALIELKARFEEEANIVWARRLERAGVHVVYGLVGLKTHAKIAVVVRRDPDRLRRYVHFSTGNYNPVTARTYTDLALMTCDEKLGDDAAALFNLLTGYSQVPRWNKAIVSPSGMREKWIELIERETAHQKAGREARLIAKLNSLVDVEVMSALVRASQAGVPIDLLVRGICCLRPGLPGLTESIRVRSIVGRYLEHSRVVYFANGGQPETYITSADWMPRNFMRRVEIAIPIERPELRQRLVNEVLGLSLLDNLKGWDLRTDGTYARVTRPAEADALAVQQVLQEVALGNARRMGLPPPLCGAPPAPAAEAVAPAAPPAKPGREPELFTAPAAGSPPASSPTPGTSRLSKTAESAASPPPPPAGEAKAAS